jgi:hypothetical protein
MPTTPFPYGWPIFAFFFLQGWALSCLPRLQIVIITIRYNYSLDSIPVSYTLTVFLHLAAEKRQGVPCPPKSLARFSPALNSPHL